MTIEKANDLNEQYGAIGWRNLTLAQREEWNRAVSIILDYDRTGRVSDTLGSGDYYDVVGAARD